MTTNNALSLKFTKGDNSFTCKKSVVKNAQYYRIKLLLAERKEAGKTLSPEDDYWLSMSDDEDEEQGAMALMADLHPSKRTDLCRDAHVWYLDSGCSKHMTGRRELLQNFKERYGGEVKFGNDETSPILGYGDIIQDKITIKRVAYVAGLGHNLFSIGQFCDKDLEVRFRSTR